MTINEKLQLISDLESEHLSESMIENIVYMDENEDEWVGPFATPEEAMSYLEEEDADESN